MRWAILPTFGTGAKCGLVPSFSVILGVEPKVAHAVIHDMGDIELFAKIKDVAKIKNLDDDIIKSIERS